MEVERIAKLSPLQRLQICMYLQQTQCKNSSYIQMYIVKEGGLSSEKIFLFTS